MDGWTDGRSLKTHKEQTDEPTERPGVPNTCQKASERAGETRCLLSHSEGREGHNLHHCEAKRNPIFTARTADAF